MAAVGPQEKRLPGLNPELPSLLLHVECPAPNEDQIKVWADTVGMSAYLTQHEKTRRLRRQGRQHLNR